MGGRVFTGTMPFRTIGTAIREKTGYSQQDLVANVLRLFCQGVKVCVEIVLMASDAGLISPDNSAGGGRNRSRGRHPGTDQTGLLQQIVRSQSDGHSGQASPFLEGFIR